MLGFLFKRVLPWVLIVIAVPMMEGMIRRLVRAVLRHAVAKPAVKALRRADSTVTDVSRRASRTVRR
jgi:hypothetical protein